MRLPVFRVRLGGVRGEFEVCNCLINLDNIADECSRESGFNGQFRGVMVSSLVTVQRNHSRRETYYEA